MLTMITMANGALSFPIKATLFTRDWYNKIVGFTELKTDKETAKQITASAFKELWKQEFVRDAKKNHCWYLYFLWLHIDSELNRIATLN